MLASYTDRALAVQAAQKQAEERLQAARVEILQVQEQKRAYAKQLRNNAAEMEIPGVSHLRQSEWVLWEQEVALSRRAAAADTEFYLAYRDLYHNEGPPIVNPALANLNVLKGEWDVEISSLDAGKAQGTVICEWMAGQAFLTMHTHIPYGWEGLTSSWTVIECSAHAIGPTAHYTSDRGEACDYFMTLENGSWILGNKTPGVWQRYFGDIRDDGNYITGEWQRSQDGNTWEEECRVVYWRNP